MDDDAPLSALAKPLKLDDDTPLASLADIGKPRASPKAASKVGVGSPATKTTPKGSPKAASVKGSAKGGKRKSIGSSSSSSSSESEESSDSESEWKPKPPKRKGSNTSIGGKKGGKKKVEKSAAVQDEEEMPEDGGGAVKKRERSPKEQVVADLLCRWWYVLPEWPPDDESLYQAELAKKSLRKVKIEEWEWVPEEDSKGRKKVYELSQFRGLFRASDGSLVDLRPRETCPCYANLMKKDVAELHDLLVAAYENQLKDLTNSKSNETQLENELKLKITKARDAAYKSKEVSGLKRRKSG